MATKRVSNAELFNTIYSACSPTFQSRIPKMDANNMQTIGMLITSDNFKAEFNEWIGQAVNRIAMVLIRNNAVENRLDKYVYGTMEFGDAIEELAVQVAKGEDYIMPANGRSIDAWRRNDPEVKALYHRVNSKKKYLVTTFPEQVKRAFINEGGISSLFGEISRSLINGANIDDWLSMKEIFNFYINDTTKLPRKETQTINVDPVYDEASGKKFIKAVKNTFSAMTFPTGCYNQQGIIRTSTPSEMTLFIRASLANIIDVDVLASAFNRDDLDFTPSSGGSRVKIEYMDDFGGVYPVDASGNRLYPIYNEYGGVTGQYAATEGGTSPVAVDRYVDPNAGVLAVLADDRFLLITRQTQRIETIWNPSGLYLNEFYHLWSQYGYTGFYNNVVFQAPQVDEFDAAVTGSIASDDAQVQFTLRGKNLRNGMEIDTGINDKVVITTGSSEEQSMVMLLHGQEANTSYEAEAIGYNITATYTVPK